MINGTPVAPNVQSPCLLELHLFMCTHGGTHLEVCTPSGSCPGTNKEVVVNADAVGANSDAVRSCYKSAALA